MSHQAMSFAACTRLPFLVPFRPCVKPRLALRRSRRTVHLVTAMETEIDALLPAAEERDLEEAAPPSIAKESPTEVKNLKRTKAWALRSVLKGMFVRLVA